MSKNYEIERACAELEKETLEFEKKKAGFTFLVPSILNIYILSN